MKVINFGSLNFDHVYQVKNFPLPGETINSTNYETYLGGKGLNQSIALQKSGVQTYHAGLIGQDGDKLIEFLNSVGVNTHHIKKSNATTGHALIQVNSEGENCIILYQGANIAIQKSDIDIVFEDCNKGDVLLLQNEINNINYILKKAIDKEMNIVFNPAPYSDSIKKLPIQNITYMILNESEAKGLSGQKDIESIIANLKAQFQNTKFVITLGKDGCYFFSYDKKIYQKSYNVTVVDTTSAGDTFIGFFIGSLVQMHSVEESLKIASKASALAITKKGSSNTIPNIDEVMASSLK